MGAHTPGGRAAAEQGAADIVHADIRHCSYTYIWGLAAKISWLFHKIQCTTKAF